MDFLANENFPLLSIRLLKEAGHRVVSIIQELWTMLTYRVFYRTKNQEKT